VSDGDDEFQELLNTVNRLGIDLGRANYRLMEHVEKINEELATAQARLDEYEPLLAKAVQSLRGTGSGEDLFLADEIENITYMPGLRLAEKLLRENGFEKSALAVKIQIRHLEAQPVLDSPLDWKINPQFPTVLEAKLPPWHAPFLSSAMKNGFKVWLERRPGYCDRGRYLAQTDAPLDPAEGWPRYYFSLDAAKAEIEAWVAVRKEAKP
jgi:hypothetical protein